MRLNNRSDAEWKKWFALLKECGISGVMFEGYNENIYRLCKKPDWRHIIGNGQ